MKKALYILAILFWFGILNTKAQINLDNLIGAAKETFGKSQETAEKKADEKSIDDLKNEITKKVKDPKFKKLYGKFSEALNKFTNESKTGKCLQIMGAYAEVLAYADFKVETANTACEKKEWLGIEGMILLAGTMINYCPQEFYGQYDEDASESEQKKIVMNYEAEIYIYFHGVDAKDIYSMNQNIDKEKTKESIRKLIIDENSNIKMEADELEEFVDAYYDFIIQLNHENIYGLNEENPNIKPHLELFNSFKIANKQLKLFGTSGVDYQGAIVDFVGKMFTPEFQLKKGLEIANESGKYKCTAK